MLDDLYQNGKYKKNNIINNNVNNNELFNNNIISYNNNGQVYVNQESGTSNIINNNNIFELKKLNLFAERKKKGDKEIDNEKKKDNIQKCKTKVFFYINPKYIIEPLKRKIYLKLIYHLFDPC